MTKHARPKQHTQQQGLKPTKAAPRPMSGQPAPTKPAKGAAAVKAKSAAGQANPTLRAPATRPGPEPRASQLNLLAEVAGRDLQRAEQHAEVPGTGRVQQAQRHQLVEPAAEAGCAETRGGNSKQVGASGEGRSSKRNSEAMGAGPSGAAHDSPAAEPKRVRRSPAERHDAAGEDDEGDGLYEPTAEDEEDAEGDEHYCSGEVVDSDGADDSGALGGDSGDRVPAGRAAARRQQKAAPSLATANTGRGQRGRGRGRGNASSGRGRGRGNASSGARHGRGRGRGAGRGAARRGRRAGRGGDADEDAPSDSTPTTPLQQQQQQQQPATFFNLPKFPSPSGLAALSPNARTWVMGTYDTTFRDTKALADREHELQERKLKLKERQLEHPNMPGSKSRKGMASGRNSGAVAQGMEMSKACKEALSRTVMDYLRGNADGAGEEGEEEEELQSEDPTLPSFYAPSLWTDPGPDLWRALVFDQLDEAHLHFGDDDDAYEDITKTFKWVFATTLAGADGFPKDPKQKLTEAQSHSLQETRDSISTIVDGKGGVLVPECDRAFATAAAAAFVPGALDGRSLPMDQDGEVLPVPLWSDHFALCQLWALDWLSGKGGPGNDKQSINRNGLESEHEKAIADFAEFEDLPESDMDYVCPYIQIKWR